MRKLRDLTRSLIHNDGRASIVAPSFLWPLPRVCASRPPDPGRRTQGNQRVTQSGCLDRLLPFGISLHLGVHIDETLKTLSSGNKKNCNKNCMLNWNCVASWKVRYNKHFLWIAHLLSLNGRAETLPGNYVWTKCTMPGELAHLLGCLSARGRSSLPTTSTIWRSKANSLRHGTYRAARHTYLLSICCAFRFARKRPSRPWFL